VATVDTACSCGLRPCIVDKRRAGLEATARACNMACRCAECTPRLQVARMWMLGRSGARVGHGQKGACETLFELTPVCAMTNTQDLQQQ
jgi:hypothetical protein